jgi:hypothetical protein
MSDHVGPDPVDPNDALRRARYEAVSALRGYLAAAGAGEREIDAFLRYHGLDGSRRGSGSGSSLRMDLLNPPGPAGLMRAAEAYVDAGFYLHRPSIESFARLVSGGASAAVLVGALAGFARHFLPGDEAPVADVASALRDLDEPRIRTLARAFLDWWASNAGRIGWDRSSHRFTLDPGPAPASVVNAAPGLN